MQLATEREREREREREMNREIERIEKEGPYNVHAFMSAQGCIWSNACAPPGYSVSRPHT